MERLKKLFDNKLRAFSAVASAVWLALYFGLGAVIFKNMWYTSPALPILTTIAALLPPAAALLNIFIFKNRIADISVINAAALFSVGYFLFFAFVISKLTYIFIAGKPYFITAGLFGLTAFLIFAFPRFKKTIKQVCAIILAAVMFTVCTVCVFGAPPFYISGGAVVFAVDGEYQIAFSTSHKSIGAVEVNGNIYFDSTNGENNVCRLHKIRISAEELDSAKSYSIITQGVALNTAYLPSKGAKIKKDYSFRPVNADDGVQIYNISDSHECIAGPANAASFFGDKLDLLILNGDIINDVSSEYQISLIYKLANNVTGGSIPVIYTRGNHECNGSFASSLGKYVGCADRGFYYRFKVGSTLSLLIIDTNNDMSDDNPLISPLANFENVRTQQSAWLKEQTGWNDAEYNFVVAHMAYPLSGYTAESCVWHDWARELVVLTDDAQLAICGHSHRTDFSPCGGDDNPLAGYPVLRGSIRSNSREHGEGVSPFGFTGAAIELKDGTVKIKFTNAKKQVIKEHSFGV